MEEDLKTRFRKHGIHFSQEGFSYFTFQSGGLFLFNKIFNLPFHMPSEKYSNIFLNRSSYVFHEEWKVQAFKATFCPSQVD